MVQFDKRQAERDNAGETHQLESTNSFSGLEPFANLPGAPSDRPPETLKGCATKTASAPGKADYGNGALPRDAGGKAFHDLLYFGERRHGGVAWVGHGQGAVGGDGGSVNHPVPRIEFQSTPPARAATSRVSMPALDTQFQSTPPARAATRRAGATCSGSEVSIQIG